CGLFFFSSRRRHTRFSRDWSSDVCSSDLAATGIRRLNRDTAAVVIEVFDGIIKHTAESVCGDIKGITFVTAHMKLIAGGRGGDRSEERRVGKECRVSWSPGRETKKMQ